MTIKTEIYHEANTNLPNKGQHIIGHQTEKDIVVYQAYKPAIADFAVQNQFLGGAEFSYTRMSWIKPNFLWMMFRCGWASKENQERVLALWIDKAVFENILSNAVFSSYSHHHYTNHDEWRKKLETKEVRLQWDPDHDPLGNKVTRRAIQLGIKGKALEVFGKQQIKKIEDITEFVKDQKRIVDANELNKLIVPQERVYQLTNEELSKRIGVTTYILNEL